MHYYQSNTSERTKIAFGLAALSIPLAWGLNKVLKETGADLWWLDAPAVWGFYGLLSAVFKKYGWRFFLLRQTGLVETPDFSGRWIGTMKSSHDDFATDHPVELNIYQDYERMKVCLKAGSDSESLMAAVFKDESTKGKLRYTFVNRPPMTAVPTMQMHEGTCSLEMSGCGGKLAGSYFSGRGRGNIGQMELRRAREP